MKVTVTVERQGIAPETLLPCPACGEGPTYLAAEVHGCTLAVEARCVRHTGWMDATSWNAWVQLRHGGGTSAAAAASPTTVH